MTSRSNQIVFFGSGPVAEASLKSLSKAFEIEAIITKSSTTEDMSKVVPSARILKADSKRELDELFAQTDFKSQVGVLIDYGVIVSSKIINAFALGIVNSHFSLLPKWRGPDPITFFMLSGEKTTGVSLMLLVEAMDEGPLVDKASITPPPDITEPALTKKLIDLSDKRLKEVLPKYLAGEIKPVKQDPDISPTYSRKISKKDGEIDWTKSAEQIEREIRAFYNWPKSYTKLGEIDLIIKQACVENQQGEPGEIEISNSGIIVFCGKNAINVLAVQPLGKKEMPVQAFLAGYKNRLLSQD